MCWTLQRSPYRFPDRLAQSNACSALILAVRSGSWGEQCEQHRFKKPQKVGKSRCVAVSRQNGPVLIAISGFEKKIMQKTVWLLDDFTWPLFLFHFAFSFEINFPWFSTAPISGGPQHCEVRWSKWMFTLWRQKFHAPAPSAKRSKQWETNPTWVYTGTCLYIFFIFPTTYVFLPCTFLYTLHLLKYTCNHVHLFAYSKISLIYLHLQHGI